jgi:hypothetical protein
MLTFEIIGRIPRIACICVAIFGSVLISSGQDVQLFTEDFETGGLSFTLNSGGPTPNSGNNQWIVNNQYNGSSTFPNTTNQNTTAGGTIGSAPTSNYLHIHSSGSGVTNANYDPNNASDNFAFMTFGLCTYGFSNVHISFFELCQGTNNDYGSIWYSADGGPWIQIGTTYQNSTVWQYQDITNDGFSNVGSLQFGFKWHNDGDGAAFNQSFGIDDINIVADYDAVEPVTINITSVSPSPVCEGTFVTLSYELSDTLCDGNYQIELSTATGTFPSPFTTWVTPINYPSTSGSLTLQLPAGATAGACYSFRISRLSPDPQITGTASACFEIIECPNVIQTLQPIVTTDPFPVCVGSAIDIPFTSTGLYTNNVYVCQLSEPDGTFSANPPVVGTSPDNSTYDPLLGQLPGSVSGIVPNTTPGCNYYLRVISTNPDAIGTPWGPFCIQECDINTNNSQDLSFCVTDCSVEPAGQNEQIDIDVNVFDNNATYLPGNVFTTQLMSSQSFTQIGANGILGQVAATNDTQLNVHVPCLDSLDEYGLPLGMNYMRVVATNSSTPNNTLGSLIRVTIGAYSNIPQTITSYEYPSFAPKDTFCVGETAALFFSPYNFMDNSTYLWSCNGINGGTPFASPSGANSNSLYVTLGAPTILTFSIQETNYGCTGPWTPVKQIVVLGDPVVNISGPTTVCMGDTSLYEVPFFPNTYYSWSTNCADNIAFQDTSNNTLNLAFVQNGSCTLSLNVLNQCGSDSDTHNVTIQSPPVLDAGEDTEICVGDDVELITPTGPGYNYQWSDDTSVIANTNSTTVSPTTTTSYELQVTTQIGCEALDTVDVTVSYPAPVVTVHDSICPGGNNSILLQADTTGAYTWSNGDDGLFTTVTDTGSVQLIIQVAGELCPRNYVYQIHPLTPDAPIILTDSICPDGSASLQLGADSSGYYSWSTGSVNRFITVSDTGVYQVMIYSPYRPCPRSLQFHITPDTCYVDTAGIDSIEPLVFWVPNAFTPTNEDDLNEAFGPVFSNLDIVDEYRFRIFNRWGDLFFESTDPLEKWYGNAYDGDYYVRDGVYDWEITFRNTYLAETVTQRGHVIIVR